MAELTTLARPYAKAAFQLAMQENALDEWSKMLALSAAVAEQEQVRLLLQAPALTSDQVAKCLRPSAGDETPPRLRE